MIYVEDHINGIVNISGDVVVSDESYTPADTRLASTTESRLAGPCCVLCMSGLGTSGTKS